MAVMKRKSASKRKSSMKKVKRTGMKKTGRKMRGGMYYSIDVNDSVGGMPLRVAHNSVCGTVPTAASGPVEGHSNSTLVKEVGQSGGGDCGCDMSPLTTQASMYGGAKKRSMRSKAKSASKKTKKSKKAKKVSRKHRGGNVPPSAPVPTPVQKGGKEDRVNAYRTEAISRVANKLVALPQKTLSKLTVSLIRECLNQNNKKNTAKQMGGFLAELSDMFVPLGVENLAVLAAILLLHYLAKRTLQKKKSGGLKTELRDSRKKARGGFMAELNAMLAPLGVNALGSAVLLVLLRQAMVMAADKKSHARGGAKKASKKGSKKGKKGSKKAKKPVRRMRGGLNEYLALIVPVGLNAFLAAAVLVILKKMMDAGVTKMKKSRTSKLHRGGNVMLKDLIASVAPMGANFFAAVAALAVIAGLTTHRKSKK